MATCCGTSSSLLVQMNLPSFASRLAGSLRARSTSSDVHALGCTLVFQNAWRAKAPRQSIHEPWTFAESQSSLPLPRSSVNLEFAQSCKGDIGNQGTNRFTGGRGRSSQGFGKIASAVSDSRGRLQRKDFERDDVHRYGRSTVQRGMRHSERG